MAGAYSSLQSSTRERDKTLLEDSFWLTDSDRCWSKAPSLNAAALKTQPFSVLSATHCMILAALTLTLGDGWLKRAKSGRPRSEVR